MNLVQKLAIRNLLRNRRRSILTSTIIVLTFSLMVVFLGLSDGGHKAMIDIGIRMGMGHILVYDEQYRDDPSLQNLIETPNQVNTLVEQHLPESEAVVPRLRLDALIQAGGSGVAITLSGVMAEEEIRVSIIADEKSIISGKPLALADNDSNYSLLPNIVIGNTLANNLEVEVGDKITITVKPDGQSDLARAAFKVLGIFNTGMHEIDSFWAEVNLPDLQNLANVGTSVSSVAIYLNSDASVLTSLTTLKAKTDIYDMQPWQLVSPELYSAVTLDEAGMYLLMLIVYIVVAVGILNTVLISTIKRNREFGVMLALGSRPQSIIKVVFWEAIYLSLFSILLGLFIGLLGHYHFATEGLNFKEVFGTTMESGGIMLPEKFYSILSPLKVLASVLFVFIITLIVTLYPAIRASRLLPIEATKQF